MLNAATDEGSQFRGGLLNQQVNFSMIKIESYGGEGGFSQLEPPFLRRWLNGINNVTMPF